MRTEYHIYQRLMWDAAFRKRFLCNRTETLREFYPEYENSGLFAETASLPGLEEEAYRRMASLHRTTKAVFPTSHNLLLAFCGNEFFERVLLEFFDFDRPAANTGQPLEILEPFDGYIVGPIVLRVIEQWSSPNQWWVRSALTYEWAIWQARRVASGWPPVAYTRPLADGTTLVSAQYDLKALLKEIKRLEASAVGNDVFRWRIEPGPGSYNAAIFPRDGQVVEASLDATSFGKLQRLVSEQTCDLGPELEQTIQRIGLVMSASFLCCSSEPATFIDSAPDLSGVVEPQPH